MSLAQKAIQGIAWGQIGILGRTLICFAISILVARALGAVQYGIYAALFSYVTMLGRFTEMGNEAIFKTYIPKYDSQNQPGRTAFLVRKILIYRIALIVTVTIALYTIRHYNRHFLEAVKPDYFILVLGWFIIHALMNSLIYIVWARLAMKYYAIVELTISIIQLFGVLYLRAQGLSVSKLIALMLIINAGQLLAYANYARTAILRANPKPIKMQRIMQFGLTLWLSTILHFFISKALDILMLTHYFKDSEQAAYYDIAYILVMTGALALINAIDSLKLPILSESWHRSGTDGLRHSWHLLTKLSIYLTVPPLFFLAIHAETIILLIYGETYLQAARLIRVFALLTALAMMLGNETAPTILFPLGKEKVYLLLHSLHGLLNLLFNIILIPEYGALGAFLGTGGARLLVGLIELGFALRLLKSRFPTVFVIGFLASTLLAAAITQLLPLHHAPVFLLLNALIYGFLITLFTAWLHPFNHTEQQILKNYKPTLYKRLKKYKLI